MTVIFDGLNPTSVVSCCEKAKLEHASLHRPGAVRGDARRFPHVLSVRGHFLRAVVCSGSKSWLARV